MGTLLEREAIVLQRDDFRRREQVVVFTNGCFDLLHRGHVDYLETARELGDVLVVGLNDDASVRRLKGASRPLMPLADRAAILCALAAVDYVVPFAEDTPAELIAALLPDILVKGADYPLEEIVGRDTVEAAGGRVERIRYLEGHSTSALIGRLRELGRER